MNITKGMTEQDYTIDEEALKDAVLGVDLASPVVTLTTKTSTTFEVGWSAITNAVGYQVSIDNGTTYGDTQVGLTFSKEDATPSTEYLVKVKAIGAGIYEDSPASTALSVNTPAE